MRLRYFSYLAGALCLCAGAAWSMSAARADDDPPDAPKGVEVQARGPVHEAYAELAEVRPEPGPIIPQKPPDPVAELPPEQKPEGDAVAWLPGYWAWDDEAATFDWVSGFWRTSPPGRDWTPGHWQEVDGGWQWAPGFWASQDIQEVEYLPPPPPSIDSGPSVPAPNETSVYVSGCWVHRETRYFWRPGYWVEYNPDWVWIPDHYCSTPTGCIFVGGYWDYPLDRRGLLFAPVRFEAEVLTRRDFAYTPEFIVQPDFLMTALFVRPSYGHYYFGDYFEDRYEKAGFTTWVDYRVGRNAIDPNFAFFRHRFRDEGRWDAAMRDLYTLRRSGDIPRPPRTWAQQTEAVHKITTSRTENVAIHEKVNLTALQSVTALTSIRRGEPIRVASLGALTGRPAHEEKPAAIKLEAVSKERQAELGKTTKEYHDFAAAQQREQAKLLSDGGVPVKPTDPPKSVKVRTPQLPARPQEPRPETKPMTPAPAPPPPPAPKHEERPIPPHDPPKPSAPPKTPAPGPKDPPTTPPKEPPTTPPKEPPTTPPVPPKEPPVTPPKPPKEPPTPKDPPPTPPKEPPTPPPPPAPPKDPPKLPPAPKDPPPTPPKEPPPPPAPPKLPPAPKDPPPTPPKEPPPPPPAPPKDPPKLPPAPKDPPPTPPKEPPPPPAPPKDPPKLPPAPKDPPPTPPKEPPPPAPPKLPPAPKDPPPTPPKEPPTPPTPPPAPPKLPPAPKDPPPTPPKEPPPPPPAPPKDPPPAPPAPPKLPPSPPPAPPKDPPPPPPAPPHKDKDKPPPVVLGV